MNAVDVVYNAQIESRACNHIFEIVDIDTDWLELKTNDLSRHTAHTTALTTMFPPPD